MAKTEICPESRFLDNVKEHEMIVLHEDGVYRHIRFKRPGTGCMHFDLVTWPGYLAYSGDMGAYVFRRLDDMFCFFRMDRGDWSYNRTGGLSINLSYWSEKLVAVDGNRNNGSAKEFSNEKFERVINEFRVEWIRRGGLNKEDRRELWDAVTEQVMGRDGYDSDGSSSLNSAYGFSERIGGKTFRFGDLFDYDFTEYTYSFVWCCYALAWGINKYDEFKEVA